MDKKKLPKKIKHQNQNLGEYQNNCQFYSKGDKRNKLSLLISTSKKWYRYKVLENIPQNVSSSKLNHNQVTLLRSEAIQILKSDYYIYDQTKTYGSKKEDFEWIKTILTNGTVNDKLAAYTILIQDSPVHNLKSLEQLIRFINPKGKRECIMAIDTVRDLFAGDLLIPQQKLSSFEELLNSVDMDFLLNSDSNNIYRRKFLLMAHVEDQIRSFYRKFLDQLVTCSHDTLEILKTKSIRTMFDLFVCNPQEEKFLLENLINKLGDPSPKVASGTARLLSQILQHHPQMKMTIVKEVERLIFRLNITARTQYYCLCFLSEIIFKSNVDQELANRVIETYFAIFTKCVKLGEVNNKTMSVLLTGVSRAFPYSKLDNEIIEKHLNIFYRLIHYVNLNSAIQTLSLIFQMVNFCESGTLTDRFYSVLYRFLLDPNLDQCSKLSLLLNITYRSLKKDPVIKRVRAFVKRLFQLALLSSSSFVIAVLILVSELLKTKEGFKIDIFQAQDENHTETLNGFHENDDETEVSGQTKSWVYVDYKNQQKNNREINTYRFDCRNPLFVNADIEPFWELLTLKNHFHPTVQMFAQKLINGEMFEYDGDPLEDFSLKRFLDRFSFKNPKRLNESKMTINSHRKVFSRITTAKPLLKIDNINLDEYLNQEENQVPIDEKFIFKFLQHRKAIKKEQQSGDHSNNDDESDIESVTSLEFNNLLDNYEKHVADNCDVDFAKDFQENTKQSKQIHRYIEDEEADFDEEFDDVSEIISENDDCESNEEDYFNFDEDPDLVKKNVKKPRNAAPFKGKRGFSSITNNIFAAAEQFDNLLEQNETDSDFDMDNVNIENSKNKSKSLKRSHRPNLRKKIKRKKN